MAVLDRFLRPEQDPDDVRMTLGEHLEELRSRVIRCLVALVLGGVFCFVFIDRIEGAMTDALYDVLSKHGYERDIVYTGVADPFVVDFQLAMILGFILTAPYILWQLWGFVAAGLYRNERKWVRRFVPVSIALFFTGALFFMIVVVPLFLDFFVSYKKDLPETRTSIPFLIGPPDHPIQTSQPSLEWPPGVAPLTLHAFQDDPVNPPEGSVWINETEREVRTRAGGKTYSFGHMKETGHRNRVRPMIDIKDYMVFILQMAAAFGIGFQVPVVVALLSTIGIANSTTMAQARKYVYFGISIAAAIVTPSPDVTSMMLLFVPMVLLYEAGLIASRMIERQRQQERAP